MPPTVHLEKVLSRAERELVRDAHKKPTDLLDLYRRFLKLEGHRLKMLHRQGEGGRALAQKRSDLMGVVLRHLFDGARETALRSRLGEAAPRLCMMAVGGFGRAELCPGSDIDLLFLYGKSGKSRPPVIDDIVEQVLYMLWDIGCGVGHSTRTMSELIGQSNEDLQTKTSLLEARYLCGDELLYQEFQRSFDAMCLKGREAEYLEWRRKDLEARHAKQGHTVFLQEPNVKQGCGGLRDFHNLMWVARVKRGITSLASLQEAGYLNLSERKRLEAAYDFILRVRNELHYLQGRNGDILTLHLQGKVANNFRYQHRTLLRRIEALMRDYFEHTREAYLITNSLARQLSGYTGSPAKIKWSFLPFQAVRAETIDGFVLRNGVLEAAAPGIFNEDPARLLRVFLIAQQRGAEIGPDLSFRIRRRLPAIDRTFIYHKSTRGMLLTLFSRKGQVGAACRSMHEHGVLGRIFPEFRPLTCLVQHEFFHRYTADEHTLKCLEMLDRIIDANEPPFSKYRPLLQKVTRPHILYLAMLLHDTGKADNPRRHAYVSATNAVRVARRLKLDQGDLAALVFLVDHHMTMSETARRRNIDDEETILEFARIVQTRERLDMLLLLTFADYQGTGTRESWSDWKDLLLWRLYDRTVECLANTEEFLQAARASLGEMQERLTRDLEGEVSADEIQAQFANLPPRYFRTIPEPLVREHIRCVHRFLWGQIMSEDAALRPVVRWEDKPDEGHSEVIVVTWERERCFAKITGAFASCDLSILSADISTRTDDIMISTFRVTTERREAVTDQRDKDAFEKTLVEALQSADFHFRGELMRSKRNPLKLDGEASFPTAVAFDQRTSPDFTLLDLQSQDSPGLLYRVACYLADHGIEVANARITTEKGAALDTLLLCDREGRKLSRELLRSGLARGLQKLLDS